MRSAERKHSVDRSKIVFSGWPGSSLVVLVSPVHELLHMASELGVGVLHGDVPCPRLDGKSAIHLPDAFIPPSGAGVRCIQLSQMGVAVLRAALAAPVPRTVPGAQSTAEAEVLATHTSHMVASITEGDGSLALGAVLVV